MVYINTTGKHNEVWLDKPYATITVECPDCPSTEDAYNSGWTDGSEDGYHKGYQSGYTDGLGACSAETCEGVWEDGYDTGFMDGVASVDCSDSYNSGVTDGYGSGYTSGYTDAWQPAYDSGFTDGLNACSGGSCEGVWEDGYLSGVTDQKNKLASTAITQNGTYTRADGWSSVTINVSGYTQEDLEAAFNRGWRDGYQSGYTDGSESGHTPTPTYSGVDAYVLYSVTSTTEPTKVLGGGLISGSPIGVKEVKLPDDTPVTLVGNTYTFDQTGIQALKITMTGTSIYEDPNTPETDDREYKSLMRYQFLNVTQLVSISIPEGIELIDNQAFYGCSMLSSVTLPNSLELISSDAFRGTAIPWITIPENVKDIYGWAFIYCDNLTQMTFLGTTPPRLGGSYALGMYDQTFPIYVPASAVNAYKNAPSWANYASRIYPIQ